MSFQSSSPQKWSQSAFPAGVQRPDVSPLSANLSSGIQLPPGLEDLSDKERQRILSVMACAQLENLNDDYIVHASSKSYSPSTVSTSMDASAVESVKRKSSLSMATTNQTTLSEYAVENVATDKVPVTGNIVGPFSKNQAASLDGDVRLAEINPTTAPEETIKLIPTNQTSSSEGAIAAVAANKADLPVDTIKAFVTNNVSSSNDNVKPDITNQKTTFSKDSVKFQTPVDESLNVNATLSPDPSVSNVYSSTVIIEDNQQVEANVTASYPERLVSDTVPTPVQKRSPQIPFEDAIQGS
ncbi:hypothetical protein AB6A40_010455 [Gnathostoma spinigerum]|uniref:Uncharacterized protein n=1 Tax=Gnathostoma spinigerum TaxID=75299 RepID=A0ABD6EWL3_9BILA